MAEQLREFLHCKIQEEAERHQALAFLRLREVRARTGLSRSTIYALIKEGKFPAQVLLGGGRAVGWIEREIIDWHIGQIEASRTAA